MTRMANYRSALLIDIVAVVAEVVEVKRLELCPGWYHCGEGAP